MPRLAIHCVDVLQTFLKASDALVQALAIQTIHALCVNGVFDPNTAWRVVARSMPRLPESECTACAWVRFHALLCDKEMEADDFDAIIGRIVPCKDHVSMKVREALFNGVLAALEGDWFARVRIEMHGAFGGGASQGMWMRAGAFLKTAVDSELVELRHKAMAKGQNAVKGTTRKTAKDRLYAIGKHAYAAVLRGNVCAWEQLGAALLWMVCSSSGSKASDAHVSGGIAGLIDGWTPQAQSSRMQSSLQAHIMTWQMFLSSWMSAPDLSGDEFDRAGHIFRTIEDRFGGSMARESDTLKCALLSTTTFSNEFAHALVPAILERMASQLPRTERMDCIASLCIALRGLHDVALVYEIVKAVGDALLSPQIESTGDGQFLSMCLECLGMAFYFAALGSYEQNSLTSVDASQSEVMAVAYGVILQISARSQHTSKLTSALADLKPKWRRGKDARQLTSAAGSRRSDNGEDLLFGLAVALGWVARASAECGEAAVYKVVRKFALSVAHDVERYGRASHDPLLSGCLQILPAMAETELMTASHKEGEGVVASFEVLVATFKTQVRSLHSVNIIAVLATSIGAMSGVMGNARIDCGADVPSILEDIALNSRLPVDLRIGCTLGMAYSHGCGWCGMPCHTYPKELHTICGDVSEGFHKAMTSLARKDREPRLRSAASWCSQIVHYVLCSSAADHDAGGRKGRGDLQLKRDSYLCIHVDRLRAYIKRTEDNQRGAAKGARMQTDENEFENGEEELLLVSTLQVMRSQAVDALGLLPDVVHLVDMEMRRPRPNKGVIAACLEVLSGHSSAKNCLVCPTIDAVVKHIVCETTQGSVLRIACEHLTGVMLMCNEGNAQEIIQALDRISQMNDEMGILVWRCIQKYVSVIYVKKQRMYRLVFDSLKRFAIGFMERRTLPSYSDAVEMSFELHRKGTCSHPWMAVSDCVHAWQLLDNELTDAMGELPWERLFLVQSLQIPKRGIHAKSLMGFQNRFCKPSTNSNSNVTDWILPLLSYAIHNAIIQKRLDIKQWMLDVVDLWAEHPHAVGTRHLFAMVTFRASAPSPVMANAAVWLSLEACADMLPYALPKLLSGLQTSFAALFVQKFLAGVPISDGRHRAAVLSLSNHVTSKDFERAL